MKVRRVVTGHNAQGKSHVASDMQLDPITVALEPGAEYFRLWGGDTPPTFPDDGLLPAFKNYFPPLGGFRFGIVTFPPETVVPDESLDMEAALEEYEEKYPGHAAYMEPDHPGMHTTDTIDCLYVISGEIWLELDDGVEVQARAGDAIVQNGTRHTWHNRGSQPCRVVAFLVGARRIAP